MEKERRRDERREEVAKEIRRRRILLKRLIIRCTIGIFAFLIGLATGWLMRGAGIRRPVDLSSIKAPEWIDQQFLTINPYSRPGTKLGMINGIVIHYIGNPGTTAQQNRDYFESLKSQSGSNTTSVSSNFIIGMDGEIIQCIPIDEKSYASNNRNGDTIAIEVCHPEADGKFTEETYESLVRLTAWLANELDLSAKEIIRHFDITGKSCPKYFVEDEKAWKQFKKDVKKETKKLN